MLEGEGYIAGVDSQKGRPGFAQDHVKKDHLKNPHGRGKGQGGKFGKKGKDKGKKGDDKGKGKDNKGKGKLHKGIGKNPERSEARRFGGKCNWCWRLGHKEAQCWFKKAYYEYTATGGNKEQNGDSPNDAGGSKDIRSFFASKKRKLDEQQEDAEKRGLAISGRSISWAMSCPWRRSNGWPTSS